MMYSRFTCKARQLDAGGMMYRTTDAREAHQNRVEFSCDYSLRFRSGTATEKTCWAIVFCLYLSSLLYKHTTNKDRSYNTTKKILSSEYGSTTTRTIACEGMQVLVLVQGMLLESPWNKELQCKTPI